MLQAREGKGRETGEKVTTVRMQNEIIRYI